MTEEDIEGKIDLFLLLDVFKQYCGLGPKQRELFKRFVDGEDLSKEAVATLTLNSFIGILTAATPFLNTRGYTDVLLEELEFLRYGYQTSTEDGYY